MRVDQVRVAVRGTAEAERAIEPLLRAIGFGADDDGCDAAREDAREQLPRAGGEVPAAAECGERDRRREARDAERRIRVDARERRKRPFGGDGDHAEPPRVGVGAHACRHPRVERPQRVVFAEFREHGLHDRRPGCVVGRIDVADLGIVRECRARR